MIKTFNTGLLGSNVHIFWDDTSNDAMIIDCGSPLSHVLPFINENGLIIKLKPLKAALEINICFLAQD